MLIYDHVLSCLGQNGCDRSIMHRTTITGDPSRHVPARILQTTSVDLFEIHNKSNLNRYGSDTPERKAAQSLVTGPCSGWYLGLTTNLYKSMPNSAIKHKGFMVKTLTYKKLLKRNLFDTALSSHTDICTDLNKGYII